MQPPATHLAKHATNSWAVDLQLHFNNSWWICVCGFFFYWVGDGWCQFPLKFTHASVCDWIPRHKCRLAGGDFHLDTNLRFPLTQQTTGRNSGHFDSAFLILLEFSGGLMPTRGTSATRLLGGAEVGGWGWGGAVSVCAAKKSNCTWAWTWRRLPVLTLNILHVSLNLADNCKIEDGVSSYFTFIFKMHIWSDLESKDSILCSPLNYFMHLHLRSRPFTALLFQESNDCFE